MSQQNDQSEPEKQIEFESAADPADGLDQTYTFDLNGCARCHGDGHEQITFTRLTHPVDKDGVQASHWAPCPVNGEPILMYFQDTAP